MIMKRHLYVISILLGLLSLVIWPRATVAGDIAWQIRWQENGVLQEKIQISGQDYKISDSNWTIGREGDQSTLYREIENWQKYGEMTDRLPLQVQQKNYLIYKKTMLTTSAVSGGLFPQLKDGEKLILNISVPGFIIGVSGDRIDGTTARWTLANARQLVADREMMTFIMIDGLILGIVIFVLGLFFIIIKFIKQLKKVDRIIAEEYSITKASECQKDDD